MKTQPLTACKQYCLAPAHAGQHKATSPTRKPLGEIYKQTIIMDNSTSSKDLKLNSVIEQIYEGDYQLPEFQRDYIWKDPNVKGLFESVLLGHPIGSILLLELNKDNPLLAWVNFSEIIPPEIRLFDYKGNDKTPPKYLVLDGQQRLTSLSRLTNGTADKIWYLNLKLIKESWEKFGSPNSEK